MSKLNQVTATFTTTRSYGEVSAALDLLAPVVMRIEHSPIPNGDAAPAPTPRAKGNARSSRKGTNKRVNGILQRPEKYTDPRLAWDDTNGRIDIDQSLISLGLTEDQLIAMHTKVGTVEYAVRIALDRQRLRSAS